MAAQQTKTLTVTEARQVLDTVLLTLGDKDYTPHDFVVRVYNAVGTDCIYLRDNGFSVDLLPVVRSWMRNQIDQGSLLEVPIAGSYSGLRVRID